MTDLTPEELQEAQSLQTEIDQIAAKIQDGERTLDTSWVRLAARVHKVRSKKYWRAFGVRSFGSYMVSLEPKIKKKRSQVYVAVSVVEQLGDQIAEEKLEEMGISKANVLASYVRHSGKIVPEDLITKALDRETDVDHLRAEVATALHQPLPERGKWFELGGFFVTDEERILLEDTLRLTKGVDPVVPHNIPEWEQVKFCVLRWVMEFRSTYGGVNETADTFACV